MLVILNLTYLQVQASESLITNPQNSRGLLSELKLHRGEIITSDNKTIALSKKSKSQYKRVYPEGEIYAHLTGYYNHRFGRSSLEQSYNKTLLGTKDIGSLESYWNSLLEEEVRGNNLILTIDSSIQELAFESLEGKKGSIVVINPKNGNIMAMASQPSFNPNKIEENWENLNRDKDRPLLNRATQSLYSPGSSFKTVSASAIIDSGLVEPDTLFSAPGQIKIYGNIISNYNEKNYGKVPLSRAYQLSINTVFAQVGEELGPEKLTGYAVRFGFNREIPIKIPYKKSFIAKPEKMDPVDTASTAIGLTSDNLEASCLQMALIAAAIANDGKIMKPRIVDKIVDYNNSIIRKEPEKTWLRPISKETADKITIMMEKVVESGTGRNAQIQGIKVAGKTGTAELENNKEPHSWFIAFAPSEDPQLAIAVMIENGGSGGKVSAPIARDIIVKVLEDINP